MRWHTVIAWIRVLSSIDSSRLLWCDRTQSLLPNLSFDKILNTATLNSIAIERTEVNILQSCDVILILIVLFHWPIIAVKFKDKIEQIFWKSSICLQTRINIVFFCWLNEKAFPHFKVNVIFFGLDYLAGTLTKQIFIFTIRHNAIELVIQVLYVNRRQINHQNKN